MKKLLRVLLACIIFASVYAPGRHTNGMNGRDAANNKRRDKRCLDVKAAWLFQSPFSTQTSIRNDPIGNSKLIRTSHQHNQIDATEYQAVRVCEELMVVSTPVLEHERVGCGALRRAV